MESAHQPVRDIDTVAATATAATSCQRSCPNGVPSPCSHCHRHTSGFALGFRRAPSCPLREWPWQLAGQHDILVGALATTTRRTRRQRKRQQRCDAKWASCPILMCFVASSHA
jgi:hypothetical protein